MLNTQLVVCSCCEGTGWVPSGSFTVEQFEAGTVPQVACQVCEGKGEVQIRRQQGRRAIQSKE
jgi:RecJ-like exonuclease